MSKIDEKVSAYNRCADSTGTTGGGLDTIPKMSKQEHVFYSLRGVPGLDTIPKMSKQEHVFYSLRGVPGNDD